jgi:hypothetical protein
LSGSVHKILEELARRAVSLDKDKVDLRTGTFPQQRAFLEDPSRFKAAHCSRGAAKSYTAGIGIYEAMLAHPGCSCFYVTKTHDMARNIMWRAVMKDINDKFKLGIDFREDLLEGRHPNGSTFRLTGIDGDRKQQDKLLGGKYKLVILDEVAFFETDLTEIIYKTLIPATGRVGGSIWMMSTSSDFPRGLFYEATRPEKDLRIKGWSVHEWQWWDNPYIKEEMQSVVDELIAANPLIVETNHFKQHYLNLWVIDESKLVYRFSPERNLITLEEWNRKVASLPPDGWSRVLGVDTGWEDDNAFVLSAYHVNDPNLYILKVFCKKQMYFDDKDRRPDHGVIQKIQEYMGVGHLAPHKVVIDGANKQGVEGMRQRSNIPFEYADKLDKATFIELCNSDLVQGKIKIVDTDENKPLCLELASLVWLTEGSAIKFPKKEHPALPNHMADAFLYGWRNGYHYHSAPAEVKVPIGSVEWHKQQNENIWERERERLIAASQGGDWPSEPEG